MSRDLIQEQRAWDAFIGSGGAVLLALFILWTKIKNKIIRKIKFTNKRRN